MRGIQNCTRFGCRINTLRAAAWFVMMQVFGIPHALAEEPASMAQQQPAIPRTKSSKDFYYPDNAKRALALRALFSSNLISTPKVRRQGLP